jgi:hypothetical protein
MRKSLIALAALAAISTSTAHAAIIVYTATLSGAAEATPNASPGTGSSTVTIDTVLNTMRVQAVFSGLTGNVTAAHIHCCTTLPVTGAAGVATVTPTFTGFPAGVTSGAYDTTFDMTLPVSWNAAFITANGGTTSSAFSALVAGLNDRKAYLNIHSTTFGGGEIRGFLAPPVPEPATWLMMLAGLGLVGAAMRSAGRAKYRVKYA